MFAGGTTSLWPLYHVIATGFVRPPADQWTKGPMGQPMGLAGLLNKTWHLVAGLLHLVALFGPTGFTRFIIEAGRLMAIVIFLWVRPNGLLITPKRLLPIIEYIGELPPGTDLLPVVEALSILVSFSNTEESIIVLALHSGTTLTGPIPRGLHFPKVAIVLHPSLQVIA